MNIFYYILQYSALMWHNPGSVRQCEQGNLIKLETENPDIFASCFIVISFSPKEI